MRYVRQLATPSRSLALIPATSPSKMPTQALSIDPINGYVLELLEMALEASADMGPFGWKGPPGGEESWERQMREHRDKGKQIAKAMSPGEDFEDSSM